MASSKTDYDEETLPRDFQDGLAATREAVEARNRPLDADVRPIADHGTNIIVRLGVWPSNRYKVEYKHDEYIVFAHIPKRFPTGGGKGMITCPPLKRSDGPLTNNSDWDNSLPPLVVRNTDAESAESYSYNWNKVTMNQPEDMVKFLRVADEFLSRG